MLHIQEESQHTMHSSTECVSSGIQWYWLIPSLCSDDHAEATLRRGVRNTHLRLSFCPLNTSWAKLSGILNLSFSKQSNDMPGAACRTISIASQPGSGQPEECSFPRSHSLAPEKAAIRQRVCEHIIVQPGLPYRMHPIRPHSRSLGKQPLESACRAFFGLFFVATCSSASIVSQCTPLST